MAKLLDFIQVPAARASILWLIGEYNEKVPKIAPDVLRKLAKSFIDEEDVVKLQILNLAVKLYLTNPQQTELLCQYVFNLARYDQNYDIRDRARFLKQFIFPAGGKQTALSQNAKNIFLAEKPAPTLESKYHGRKRFQLGSLSHYLNMRVSAYQDLPPFPEVAPDSSVRHVEMPTDYGQPMHATDGPGNEDDAHKGKTRDKKNAKTKSFYSESDKSSSADESSSESSSGSSGSTEPGSGSGSDSDAENGNEISKTLYNEVDGATKSKEDFESLSSGSEDESEDSSSSGSYDSSSSDEDSGSSSESKPVKPSKAVAKANTTNKPSQKSNLDLLLDLDDIPPVGPIMTPSLGGFLTPMTGINSDNPATANVVDLVGPSFIPNKSQELLNKVNGSGLGITYRFTRAPHLYSAKMISIELTFTNHGNMEITDVQISQRGLQAGMSLNETPMIENLNPKQSWTGVLGLDFNDSTQPANFEIKSNSGVSNVTLKAPVGELIRSVTLPDSLFLTERAKLRGMTEHSSSFALNAALSVQNKSLHQKIFEVANVANIPSSEEDKVFFAAQTMSSKSLVLIVLHTKDDSECSLTVNCDKMVVGSMLLNEIKAAIKN